MSQPQVLLLQLRLLFRVVFTRQQVVQRTLPLLLIRTLLLLAGRQRAVHAGHVERPLDVAFFLALEFLVALQNLACKFGLLLVELPEIVDFCLSLLGFLLVAPSHCV